LERPIPSIQIILLPQKND